MGQVRTLIGRGIYDSDEISRLTRVPVRAVSRWAGTAEHGGGLLFPADRRLFSFWDLITVRATAGLIDRGVPLANVRDARDHLASRVDSPWPLAHYAILERIGHVGRNVYVQSEVDDEWLDATLGGQGSLDVVVGPLLQRLTFDQHGLASSWSPTDGIVLRPTVQAGSPCVEGTRIVSALLADLQQQGETIEDLADDYELTPELVQRAIDYEQSLERTAA